ncbi:MAG: hypothetical protein AAF503_09660 [Pseudomonadota bacterium]
MCVPSLLIVAGFGVMPSFDFSIFDRIWHSSFWLSSVVILILLAPFLPLAIACFGAISRPQWNASTSIGCALAAGSWGVILTPVVLMFSGPGSIPLIAYLSINLSVWGILLCFVRDDVPTSKLRAIGSAMLVVAMVGPLWSLSSGIRAAWSAYDVADGHAFCIGYHGPDKPLRALSDLRGGWMWTDHSGYKIGSKWYFHAILIREDGEIYNWSHRKFRFERLGSASEVKARRFIAGPFDEICAPKERFLVDLPWF